MIADEKECPEVVKKKNAEKIVGILTYVPIASNMSSAVCTVLN